jgi:hypothetical protein
MALHLFLFMAALKFWSSLFAVVHGEIKTTSVLSSFQPPFSCIMTTFSSFFYSFFSFFLSVFFLSLFIYFFPSFFLSFMPRPCCHPTSLWRIYFFLFIDITIFILFIFLTSIFRGMSDLHFSFSSF